MPCGGLPTLKFEDAYGKVHGQKLCSHHMCERARGHLPRTLNEETDEHRLILFYQLEKSTCRKFLREVLSECMIVFNKSRGEGFSPSKKHTVTSWSRWKQCPLGTWVLRPKAWLWVSQQSRFSFAVGTPKTTGQLTVHPHTVPVTIKVTWWDKLIAEGAINLKQSFAVLNF